MFRKAVTIVQSFRLIAFKLLEKSIYVFLEKMDVQTYISI